MSLPNISELEQEARKADPTSLFENLADNAVQVWVTNKYTDRDKDDSYFGKDANKDIFAASDNNKVGSDADFDDCVTFVTALVTASATTLASTAGPVAAIAAAGLGAGGGIVVSRLVCRRIIKEEK